MNIQIKKVVSKKDLNQFIGLPWKIYKNDSNWIPPLKSEIKNKLNVKKNPFFEHGEMELFLALKNEEIVGRIAAIIDRNNNKTHKENVVFFGMFECVDDFQPAKDLLDRVVLMGKERGMDILRGPVNLSLNDECAFLIEGFDFPPAIMMPYNPPYYLENMKKYGLRKAKDLYAYLIDKKYNPPESMTSVLEKMSNMPDLTFRKVDLKNILEEVKHIARIYNEAWKDNWGFVEWSQNEIEHMAMKLKKIADPELILFAEDKGIPVGFGFGLPNYNEILKKINGRMLPFGFIKFLFLKNKIEGFRALVFGIQKKYRNSGLSYLLFSHMEKNALASGYKWCESSWQLEDNEAVNRFSLSLGGKLYKKYRIFEKPLDGNNE